MKKCSKILYESANILCWFRITASVLLAVTTKTSLALAVLFAFAFISDALDGWCYRKFAKTQPYQHWFNKLPITMDPIADFFIVGGGLIHVMDNKIKSLSLVIVLAIAMSLVNLLCMIVKDRLYVILATGLTYGWFSMMLISMVLVWRHDCRQYWLVGVSVTLVTFYAIWFKTRVKSRTIRRRG